MKIKYPIGGYAPGNYQNNCITCEEDFIGDKLAVQCEACAINTVNDSIKEISAKLNTLEKALKEIKKGNETIEKYFKD